MKVTLVFVPPGGGEADYSLEFELPELPQAGDYISISRPAEEGTIDFIAKRTWWSLDYPSSELYADPNNPVQGTFQSAMVECEVAIGPRSSASHIRSCKGYEARKGKLLEFDVSTY